MGDHDHSYKRLFSHPQMVEDLLRGFVREPWVEQLDFRTLEKVSGSYVTDDLRDREDDLIWRVRWGGADWLYVYLLLEFQSTIERFMAVRVMVYEGLLYQDLIEQKQLTRNGLLPPVLPIVLYNGDPRWNAPEQVADLIDTVPGGLERYRPTFRYLVLDEGRYKDEELQPLCNVVAAVFRLENSRRPEDVIKVLTALIDWLQTPDQAGLRQALTTWLNRVLLPRRVPGVTFPEVNELLEIKTMLAERVKEWTHDWVEKGRAEGALMAQRQMVTQQLEIKFGPLSEDHRQRLDLADSMTLLEWSRRLLSANSIDEVFRNGRSRPQL